MKKPNSPPISGTSSPTSSGASSPTRGKGGSVAADPETASSPNKGAVASIGVPPGPGAATGPAGGIGGSAPPGTGSSPARGWAGNVSAPPGTGSSPAGGWAGNVSAPPGTGSNPAGGWGGGGVSPGSGASTPTSSGAGSIVPGANPGPYNNYPNPQANPAYRYYGYGQQQPQQYYYYQPRYPPGPLPPNPNAQIPTEPKPINDNVSEDNESKSITSQPEIEIDYEWAHNICYVSLRILRIVLPMAAFFNIVALLATTWDGCQHLYKDNRIGIWILRMQIGLFGMVWTIGDGILIPCNREYHKANYSRNTQDNIICGLELSIFGRIVLAVGQTALLIIYFEYLTLDVMSIPIGIFYLVLLCVYTCGARARRRHDYDLKNKKAGNDEGQENA